MDLENLDEAGAMEIVNNSANEYHERLHGGDPVIKSLVEKAFARANPERDASIRDSQTYLPPSGPVDEQPVREPASYTQPANEYPPAETEAFNNLRAEWGADFRQNVENGAVVLREIFPSQEQFDVFLHRSGILNDAQAVTEAMRLLARLGARRR